MKRLFHFLGLSLTVLLMYSCYDDTWVHKSLSDLEGRFLTLEQRCSNLNEEVTALSAIVNAYNSGNLITSVTPLMEGNKEIGWTITFMTGDPVHIYHGRDGQDGVDVGSRPDLGVREDTDGIYYWTLNGDWLLDGNGNKVKASATDGADGDKGDKGDKGDQGVPGQNGAQGVPGQDGKDGVTPKFKIVDGYWYVSYDNGLTYEDEPLGKATGENGKDGVGGGDSIFTSVTEDNDYVYFTLAKGGTFKIQKAAGSGLNITFDVEQGVAIVPGTTLKVRYTVTGSEGEVLVRVLVADWQVASAVKPVDASSGYLYIHVTDDSEGSDEEVYDDYLFGENVTTGDVMTSYMSVLVSVSDDSGNSVLKALNIVYGKLVSAQDAFLAEAVAGTVTASVNTNVKEGSYTVDIPKSAQSWLSYQPVTKAAMRTDELKFRVTANEGSKFRSAPVSLKNEMGQILGSFVIVQKSSNAQEVVEFADPVVKEACVARYDENSDGNLTYEELAVVTSVKDLFDDNRNITSFDEFQYFTSVTVVPEGMFMECSGLESIVLPESVTVIESSAFNGCRSLTSIDLHEGLLEIGGSAFRSSGLEGLLVVPESIKYVGWEAFCDTYIYAAHMLSEDVPGGRYDESQPFDSGVTVYVPDQAVKKYGDSYSYSNCNIVPASLIDCSLDVSVSQDENAVYSEGLFFFPLNVTVSGDISKFEDIEEFGYYYAISSRWIWSESDEFTYVPLTSAGTPVERSLVLLYSDEYVWEEDVYSLTYQMKVGAYVILKDGTVIKYGQKKHALCYGGEYPTFNPISVEKVSFSDGDLYFTLVYDADGMFFVDSNGGKRTTSWYWEVSISDKTGTFPAGPFFDGKGQKHEMGISLSDIEETMYMTLVLKDEYDRDVTKTILFTLNPDGTVVAEIGGSSPSEDDLSKYYMDLHFDHSNDSYYGNDNFIYSVQVAIEADSQLLEKSAEYGFYVQSRKNEDNVSYFSLGEYVNNGVVDGTIGISAEWHNPDIYSYTSSADFIVGPYVVSASGQTVRYEGRSVLFEYNQKPAVTFTSANTIYEGEQERSWYEYKNNEETGELEPVLVSGTCPVYMDTLNFTAQGTYWMTETTHFKIVGQMQTDGYQEGSTGGELGRIPGDGDWMIVNEHLLTNDLWKWNYEYILYRTSDERYHVSDNYVKRTWNADNTCSYEIVNEAPVDPYLYYVPESTKSARNYVEIPVARKAKSGTVAKMVASESTLPPLFKRSTLVR